MYSKTIIVGNVGRHAEMRMTPDGKSVTQFSVAVNIGFGENKKTQWYEVVTWEKQAETCNQYVKKGMKVLCDGALELNQYTAKDGTPKASLRLTAREVKFLSSRDEQAAPAGDFGQPDDAGIPF
jgi:single-strand DNA-binding protein